MNLTPDHILQTGLAFWAYATSVSTVLFFYFLPYMVTNAQLVAITLLQHTHVDA